MKNQQSLSLKSRLKSKSNVKKSPKTKSVDPSEVKYTVFNFP